MRLDEKAKARAHIAAVICLVLALLLYFVGSVYSAALFFLGIFFEVIVYILLFDTERSEK